MLSVTSFYLEYEYLDGRSQIKVHTDKRTPAYGAQCSLAVTHPGTNGSMLLNFSERATELALVATVRLIVLRQVTPLS